jgi:hypothetical protein
LRSFATIIQYLAVKASTFDAFRQLGWKNRKITGGCAKLLILQRAPSDYWGKVFLARQILPVIKLGYEQRKPLMYLSPFTRKIQRALYIGNLASGKRPETAIFPVLP